MLQETQISLAKRLIGLVDDNTTDLADDVMLNPVENYISPARLQHEKEVLFRQYPLLMGFSGQIPNPGDFKCDDESGVPILIVRGKDGEVNAFLNVCRHRGARVADGKGSIGNGNFLCPYHGWCFNHKGALTAVPDERNFNGMDRGEYGLTRLPVVEKYGMIWVCPTPGNEFDIDTQLAGLAPEFANYGFEKYHHFETREIRQKMNWKLVIDTFLEPYHFGVLHATTVGPLFHANTCTCDGFGQNLREVLPRRSIHKLLDQPEDKWDLVTHTGIAYQLFPNAMVIMLGDHAETWRVYPDGDKVDECVMFLDLYTPEPVQSEKARKHWDANLDLTVRTVQDEDFPASEGMQFGFNSPAQETVIYGRNEPALAYYQTELAKALA